MQFERQARKSQHVNLTPLIDVVFLLIVFFMLSTTFSMSESIELLLPSDGKQAQEAGYQSVMSVLVYADGSAQIDGQTYTKEDTMKLVKNALNLNLEQRFVLLAAKNVTVQQLVSMMDQIYLNGGKNVQIDHYYAGEGPDLGGDVHMEN